MNAEQIEIEALKVWEKGNEWTRMELDGVGPIEVRFNPAHSTHRVVAFVRCKGTGTRDEPVLQSLAFRIARYVGLETGQDDCDDMTADVHVRLRSGTMEVEASVWTHA